MRQLKLIWDFRGPDAQKIAEHHLIHLNDYIKRESLSIDLTGTEDLHTSHSIAYMVVDEDQMKPLRDALKPHRGQLFSASE